MNEVKYKRGDLSPCGTKRFWAYQNYFRKDGQRTITWIPTHRFDQHKTYVMQRDEKTNALRERIRRLK